MTSRGGGGGGAGAERILDGMASEESVSRNGTPSRRGALQRQTRVENEEKKIVG